MILCFYEYFFIQETSEKIGLFSDIGTASAVISLLVETLWCFMQVTTFWK